MTYNPARVVAVVQLLLDVLDDLADVEMDAMDRASADLAILLFPFRDDLVDVLATARAEMNAMAPRLLAEGNPVPG